MTEQPREGMNAQAARLQREAKEKQETIVSVFKASRSNIPDHIELLVIAYDTVQGNVQINGPIMNKHMCYKMFEGARDIIAKHPEYAGEDKYQFGMERPLEGVEVLVITYNTKDDTITVTDVIKGKAGEEDEVITKEVKTGTQTMSISDRAIIAALVNSIKEQQAQIQAQQDEIKKLNERITNLEKPR